MQQLINYFLDKYSSSTVTEKLEQFNELIHGSTNNKFSFLLHLEELLGTPGLNDLIKKEPQMLRDAEKDYSRQTLQALYPQLQNDELDGIVVQKKMSIKEHQFFAKIESQLAEITMTDLMFLDMLGANHPALMRIKNLQQQGDQIARKFLKFETKIYADNDLDTHIEENKIELGKYLVELSQDPMRTMQLRIIDWRNF